MSPAVADLRPPLAITFDFWDTLVRAPSAAATRSSRRRRVHAIVEHETGATVDEEQLDRVLADVRRAFDEKWKNNEQFTGPEASELMLERLGLDPEPAVRRRVADGFMGVDDEWLPALTDNIEATLRTLRGHDVRIGIICDVGLSPSFVLRSHLERHGVLELFDYWSFSDEVGVYKPDGRIFAHALAGLGEVDPGRAAHVGDLRRTDVAGALAFGMTAVRYTGSNDDTVLDGGAGEGDRSMEVSDGAAPEAHHVIDDHADLPAVLGFGQRVGFVVD